MNNPGSFQLTKWCMRGFWGILIAGSLWHSMFIFTGQWRGIAWMFPENESVWEHLKMGVYGVLLFAVPEIVLHGRKLNNYWLARTAGMYIIIATVLIVFYSYTLFTHRSILWVDIGSFIAGCALCQWFCCRLFRQKNLPVIYSRAAILLLMATILVFAWFTYFPPEYPIFKSEDRQTYGIP